MQEQGEEKAMSRHAYKMQASRNIIRRLLEEDYRTSTLNEPVARFKSRMELVAAHMNSPAFSAAGGRGLCGLARDSRWRCEEVVKRKGERLPK